MTESMISKTLKACRSLSGISLIALFACLAITRIGNIDEREISWDVLGYYLYLPSGLIYDDPALQNPEWLVKVNQEKQLSGTLYQISSNDQGEPIYFFLMGMALLYLPFFLTAHYLAGYLGFPADGFSMPYQVLLVIGGLLYTLLGMIFFRKILTRYLPEKITAAVFLLIYLGTNAIHHLNIKNLETVNMLFTLACLLIWLTIRWYENPRLRYMAGIAACAALMVLIKPSEVFIILIPLLWNFDGILPRIRLFFTYWKHLALGVLVGLVIVLPQVSYWYFRTGHLIYDSYKNPAVGLDLSNPHILEILFSFRKGWLVYTPLMALALLGMIQLWRKNPRLFPAVFTYFILSFYIIASWTEWWYGASYSIRPLIVTYPLLGLSLGYLLQWISEKGFVFRLVSGILIVLLVLLNLFQYYQFRNHILDPYRTTWSYYKAIFLKTEVPSGAEKLLSVNRDLFAHFEFNNPQDYRVKEWSNREFDKDTLSNIVRDEDGRRYYRMRELEEFALSAESPFGKITSADHVWFRVSFDLRFPMGTDSLPAYFVTTMERPEGVYGYRAHPIKPDENPGQWKTYTFDYLSPEIRERTDIFKCYFWKRSHALMDIDNFSIHVYEP